MLKQQAQRSNASGIVALEARQAQEKANEGYVVIGAWENINGSPHFVTVRPVNDEYDDSTGPMVAHVGARPNGVKTARDTYGRNTWRSVCWYYNQRQDFIYDYSYINDLKKIYTTSQDIIID